MNMCGKGAGATHNGAESSRARSVVSGVVCTLLCSLGSVNDGWMVYDMLVLSMCTLCWLLYCVCWCWLVLCAWCCARVCARRARALSLSSARVYEAARQQQQHNNMLVLVCSLRPRGPCGTGWALSRLSLQLSLSVLSIAPPKDGGRRIIICVDDAG